MGTQAPRPKYPPSSGGGGGGGGPVTVTGSAAIDQYALLKTSGTNTYAMLNLAAGDDPSQVVGVAATACSGSGQSFTAYLGATSAPVTCLSDGTGTIANGASVTPSRTVAGRVMAGNLNSIGVNVAATVAATVNAQVSVL